MLNDKLRGRKGGSNRRLAIMLGWFTKDNQIKANIPNKDRSSYSQEKYKFFLDAPFEISNKCCDVMKKEPAHRYAKETGRKPITAQMASESRLRQQKWIQNGCNAFEAKNPISNPMSFWTEQDVLVYIKEYLEPPVKEAWNNVSNSHGSIRRKARKYLKKVNYSTTGICSVYGDIVKVEDQMSWKDCGYDIGDDTTLQYKTTGCTRTGCMLCGFGCHLEDSPTRFERLHETHPKMYNLLDVVENNGITYREAIDWTNEHGNLDIKY